MTRTGSPIRVFGGDCYGSPINTLGDDKNEDTRGWQGQKQKAGSPIESLGDDEKLFNYYMLL